MRYIDHSKCKSAFETGVNKDIKSMGALTSTACKIAEENKLGVLKNRMGEYRIIAECGMGAYEDFLADLKEVDTFLKHLDKHKNTRY